MNRESNGDLTFVQRLEKLVEYLHGKGEERPFPVLHRTVDLVLRAARVTEVEMAGAEVMSIIPFEYPKNGQFKAFIEDSPGFKRLLRYLRDHYQDGNEDQVDLADQIAAFTGAAVSSYSPRWHRRW